jgi:uracil-DNA glycosylase family 4
MAGGVWYEPVWRIRALEPGDRLGGDVETNRSPAGPDRGGTPMGGTEASDLSDMSRLLGALAEYLRYLMECGLADVCLAAPSGKRGGAGRINRGDAPAERCVDSLERIREEAEGCTRCRLADSRTRVVFGEGDPCARIVFVGEGPGYEEDRTGRPFVGKAGQLLTQIIEAGMGISRETVYICNVVKCRPPHNREPHEDEVRACFPFLERQIAVIRPAVIIALGSCASSTLTGTRRPISVVRGTVHAYRETPVVPTYHPAFVLRNYTQAVRRQVWDDVRKAMAILKAAESGR